MLLDQNNALKMGGETPFMPHEKPSWPFIPNHSEYCEIDYELKITRLVSNLGSLKHVLSVSR